MKKIYTLLAFAPISLATFAQIPSGMYAETEGLTGYALKTKLHQITKATHQDKGYGALWTAFKTTDVDQYYEQDGSVLDIYSENPNGTDPYVYYYDNNDQCGNYRNEGDCYNREHLVPQSLFNQASPMKNDVHFIFPTDGKVNGQRGNLPFGKVNSPNWTSSNGSKRGPNATPGFNQTVFEPIDEFKGDVARAIFYFVTRYQNLLGNFSQGNILNANSPGGLQQWQVDLLLEWHHLDPVSDRERDRNDAAYLFQKNRNPFVDYPHWVDCIWGTADCSDSSTSVRPEQAWVSTISIYPNPAEQNLTIYFEQSTEVQHMSIYSIEGILRQELPMVQNASQIELPLNELSSGIYYIRINTAKGIAVKKFIKL